MRYASLSKSAVTRIMIVISAMFIQDLYEKYYDKKKRVILTSSRTLDSSTKQHATR